jgi:branched-chain amino acid transport system permease protein
LQDQGGRETLRAIEHVQDRGGAFGRGLLGAVPLVGFLILIAILAPALGGGTVERTTITFLTAVAAVIGLGSYMGNSGTISFVHPAFMAVAAYTSGILTISPTIKERTLPEMPRFLASAQVDPLPALVLGIVAAAVLALIIGAPLARLSGAGAAIYTLAWLIIVHVVLIAARDITRGASTFFGVPRYVTLSGALAIASVAVVLARVHRESRIGLDLRASREDELAARSTGVPVYRARLFAFVLSAAIVGSAGVLFGHTVGAFSPTQFYFTIATTYLAMLIVGGQRTVTGAIAGATAITLLIEVARRLEEGFALGPLEVGQVFGLTQFALGLTLLFILYRRPEGIFGQSEIDRVIRLWLDRQQAAGEG